MASTFVVRLLATLALAGLVLASGCAPVTKSATSPTNGSGAPAQSEPEPTSGYHEFEDIRIPNELSRDHEASYIFETNTFRTGVLVYSGSVETSSLVDFYINNMISDGWQKHSSLKAKKSIIVFEKPGKSCVITIMDKSFTTTRVEILVVELRGPNPMGDQGSSGLQVPLP
jgi:hypothetical protein